MKSTQPKYTAEQWNTCLPALDGLAGRTVKIAHAVLVEGKKPVEVANELGQSRQLVHAAVTRVREILQQESKGLVPVLEWLTPEEARQVRQMAEKHKRPKKKDAQDPKS